MKFKINPISLLTILILSTVSILEGVNCTLLDDDRQYLQPDEIFIEKGVINVLLGNEWSSVNCVRVGEMGVYVFREDLENYGSRIVTPERWTCPYCGMRWNLGEKCKNAKCPTNQWEKEEKQSS